MTEEPKANVPSPGASWEETAEFERPPHRTTELPSTYQPTGVQRHVDPPTSTSLSTRAGPPLGALVAGGLLALLPIGLALALLLPLIADSGPGDDRSDEPSDEAATATIGTGGSESADSEPASPTTAVTSVPSTSEPTTSTTATSTTSDQSVAPPPGTDGTAGSGCTPGPGPLPDGRWFGRTVEMTAEGIEFDLMCAWTGADAAARARDDGVDAAPAVYATNENPVTRSVEADAATIVMLARPDGSLSQPVRLQQSDPLFVPSGAPMLSWVTVRNGRLAELEMVNATDVVGIDRYDRYQLVTPLVPNGCELTIGSVETVVVGGIPADDPDGGLNLRAEPRLDSTIVRTVPNGTTLSRLADCRADNSGRTWSKLELDGRAAWAVADYLRRP